mmetsp:Transcript_11071/g.18531  ORF Transcript_11071/g.18531 Transcript_11071/m.18531 type:complete len:88 (-) Transcript_11071:73-336(-)
MLYEKKVHKLDHDQKTGNRILIVLSIETQEKVIQATIREHTNLELLSDKIALLSHFKSFPRKFKELFHNYLRELYTSQLNNTYIPPE